MKLKGLLRSLQDAGIRPRSISVFLLLREMIRPNEDCRTAAACREIADTFDYPYVFIHRCLKEFISKGWLEADIKSRAYTIVKLGPAYRIAVGETENETSFETANSSNSRRESHNTETGNETRNGHTGVSRLRRSSPALEVSHSGDVDLKHHAPKKPARRSKAEKPKVEGRRQLGDHIVATWESKTRIKFPPDKAGWVLLDELINRFQPDALAALWDRYLRSSDPFHAKNAFKLRFFHAAVDGIALNDGTYKRDAARYFSKWFGGPLMAVEVEEPRAPIAPPREIKRQPIPTMSDAEYEENRQAIVAEIEARKARELEELPV